MSKKEKTVAFYAYPPKLHSLYREIVGYPPAGYRYEIEPSKLSKSFTAIFNKPSVKSFALHRLNKVIDTTKLRDRLFRFKKFPPHNLLYSTGHLCWRDEPWIVDMEFPSSFTGYDMRRFERDRWKIAKLLASGNCKRIIPWTNAACAVVKRAFPDPRIAKKVVCVPNAVPPKKVRHQDRGDGITRFLFVGSANLIEDFEIKGGSDVLEAFARLRKSRKDVELVVRCYVPPDVLKKYRKMSGLKIVTGIVPFRKLEEMYTTSDVFVGVAHHTPCLAHLEAMSYGLPVIATDVWENARIVSKDVGILIPKHAKGPYFEKYGMPHWGAPDFLPAIAQPDEKRIKALVAAMQRLVDDPTLRAHMSAAALKRATKGKYSIEGRNKLLKNIYDDATKPRKRR